MIIFWSLREHGRAELALWAVVGMYMLLLVRWSDYIVVAMAHGPPVT